MSAPVWAFPKFAPKHCLTPSLLISHQPLLARQWPHPALLVSPFPPGLQPSKDQLVLHIPTTSHEEIGLVNAAVGSLDQWDESWQMNVSESRSWTKSLRHVLNSSPWSDDQLKERLFTGPPSCLALNPLILPLLLWDDFPNKVSAYKQGGGNLAS